MRLSCEVFGDRELLIDSAPDEPGDSLLVTLMRAGRVVWVAAIPASMRYDGSAAIITFVESRPNERRE